MAAKTVSSTATVTLTKNKDCKGSVQYATTDPNAPITNIYLSRKFSTPMPETIVVAITAQ